MPIELIAKGSNYKLKVIPGKTFDRDRDKVMDLPDRKGVWVENSRGIDVFSHWQVPRADIKEILSRWHRSDIFGGDNAMKDIEKYETLMTPLRELERIPREGWTFSEKPYKFQRRYIFAHPSKRRLINCFVTGLGKTFCSLARMKVLGFSKCVIFTIDGVGDQWETAIRKEFGEEVTYYNGESNPKKRQHLREKVLPHAKFIITSYSLGHELYGLMRTTDSVVFDEADLLQNPDNKRAESFKPLIHATFKANAIVQVLTATPIGNRQFTIWPLLKLIHPYLAGSRKGFQERFETVEEYKTVPLKLRTSDGGYFTKRVKQPARWSANNPEEFKRLLSACMVRQTERGIVKYKEDVRIVPIRMTKAQRQVYKELKEDLEPEMKGRKIKTAEVRVKMLRLLQAAEGLMNFDDESKESGKYEHLRDLLKRAPKSQKICIWGRFKKLQMSLYKRFASRAVLYNGDMNKSQKLLAKWSFHGVKDEAELAQFDALAAKYNWKFRPGEAQFFFGIIHSQTSRGLDLQSCDWQIFTSFSFSGYAMTQTKGRICRIGQKSKLVKTWYLVAENTWEEQALTYILERCAAVKMTLDGKEALKKDSISALLKILKRYG